MVPKKPSMGVRRVDNVHVAPDERACRSCHDRGCRLWRWRRGPERPFGVVVVVVVVISGARERVEQQRCERNERTCKLHDRRSLLTSAKPLLPGR